MKELGDKMGNYVGKPSSGNDHDSLKKEAAFKISLDENGIPIPWDPTKIYTSYPACLDRFDDYIKKNINNNKLFSSVYWSTVSQQCGEEAFKAAIGLAVLNWAEIYQYINNSSIDPNSEEFEDENVKSSLVDLLTKNAKTSGSVLILQNFATQIAKTFYNTEISKTDILLSAYDKLLLNDGNMVKYLESQDSGNKKQIERIDGDINLTRNSSNPNKLEQYNTLKNLIDDRIFLTCMPQNRLDVSLFDDESARKKRLDKWNEYLESVGEKNSKYRDLIFHKLCLSSHVPHPRRTQVYDQGAPSTGKTTDTAMLSKYTGIPLYNLELGVNENETPIKLLGAGAGIGTPPAEARNRFGEIAYAINMSGICNPLLYADESSKALQSRYAGDQLKTYLDLNMGRFPLKPPYNGASAPWQSATLKFTGNDKYRDVFDEANRERVSLNLYGPASQQMQNSVLDREYWGIMENIGSLSERKEIADSSSHLIPPPLDMKNILETIKPSFLEIHQESGVSGVRKLENCMANMQAMIYSDWQNNNLRSVEEYEEEMRELYEMDPVQQSGARGKGKASAVDMEHEQAAASSNEIRTLRKKSRAKTRDILQKYSNNCSDLSDWESASEDELRATDRFKIEQKAKVFILNSNQQKMDKTASDTGLATSSVSQSKTFPPERFDNKTDKHQEFSETGERIEEPVNTWRFLEENQRRLEYLQNQLDDLRRDRMMGMGSR